MIERSQRLAEIRSALRRSRVVALVGPRQSGKTTLARSFVAPGSERYFDLENPRSLARLAEPMTALEGLRGVVVIDEVQRRPELFPVLRVLADRRSIRARFLILGSASPALLQQSSESLAGRLQTLTLAGFSLAEVGAAALRRHWRRGGFPLAYTARSEQASFVWRDEFTRTFFERDLPQLGIQVPAPTLQRFWTMLAHYHGGVWNAAEAARSLATTEPTARRYLDLWESQLAALAGNPAIAEQMTRLFKALGETMAAVSGRGGVDAHEGTERRRGGKARTPTAGAASGDGGPELARLGRRLADLERRLGRLESAAGKPRKNGARSRKRAR